MKKKIEEKKDKPTYAINSRRTDAATYLDWRTPLGPWGSGAGRPGKREGLHNAAHCLRGWH